ncbi:MAG: slipin family protein [Gammaproteobacteria bacterium]|nr:slipin family protein [Gammaproteobacteria bacterium]
MEVFILFALVIVGFILLNTIRVIKQFERGVVLTFGRFWGIKAPGLRLLIPGVQTMVRIDLRTVVMDIPSQDVILRDNVSARVNAVLYFRVVDPEKAYLQVQNYYEATNQLAQTTLRSVLGQHELDDVLSERDKLNADIQKILDSQTDAWGIKVGIVEIKHIDIDESMIRAIAKQAEAERERRAKVIHAEGELQASAKLAEAAEVLSSSRGGITLRYLQTLNSISEENATTIVFPVDLLEKFAGIISGAKS